MSQFDAFITSLRHGFGEQDAGLKFEVFCKWFLENDPEWSRTVDKVWLWDEYSRVPKGHCVDGIKLGSWVSTLRQKQSNLTPEQIDRLKAIDFVWDVADAAWRSGFNS
jgi:predicted helicase